MEVEEIIEKHTHFLNRFIETLINDGLSEKTIKTHLINIDLFLNYYLPYYWDSLEELDILDLMRAINEYFGDWYVRKVLFSSVSSMKSIF